MVNRQSLGMVCHKVAVACVLDQPGDAVHGPGEWLLLPPVAVRRPILDRGHTVGVGNELQRIGALRAEAALVHWALRIALDVDDLLRLRENKETAPDGAIRAHTLRDLCSTETGLRRRRAG